MEEEKTETEEVCDECDNRGFVWIGYAKLGTWKPCSSCDRPLNPREKRRNK